MNVYRKAHELGWQVKQISASQPYTYWVEPLESDRWEKYFATGKRDLEELLVALEEGRSTVRWEHPHGA